MRIRKPVRTEYCGTVFRSKSEAVFARCLDLSPRVWEWCYEPDSRGHEWDFAVWDGARNILVELKPLEPTETYVENLIESERKYFIRDECDRCGRYDREEFGREAVLVWGSPWNGPPDIELSPPCSYVLYPLFTSYGRYGYGDFYPDADHGDGHLWSWRHPIGDILGITEELAQEARQFRFDLAKGGLA